MSRWTKHKEALRLGITAGVLLIVLVAVVLLPHHYRTRTEQTLRALLTGPIGELRSQASQVQGRVTSTTEGKIRKVEYRFRGATPEAGKKYLGWLFNDKTSATKYAGEFYPVGEGEYALVFTTEEGTGSYTHVLISLEGEVPDKPTQIVLGGSL